MRSTVLETREHRRRRYSTRHPYPLDTRCSSSDSSHGRKSWWRWTDQGLHSGETEASSCARRHRRSLLACPTISSMCLGLRTRRIVEHDSRSKLGTVYASRYPPCQAKYPRTRGYPRSKSLVIAALPRNLDSPSTFERKRRAHG